MTIIVAVRLYFGGLEPARRSMVSDCNVLALATEVAKPASDSPPLRVFTTWCNCRAGYTSVVWHCGGVVQMVTEGEINMDSRRADARN